MLRTVFFRTEASLDIGAGHVMRCLALANALKEGGWQCHFLTSKETIETVPSLSTSKHSVHDTKNPLRSTDLLIVDHYGLDAKYETLSRQWAKNILVIDDLANRTHDCDFLLDQTYGRAPKDYGGLVPAKCQIFAGVQYSLLRKEFAKMRPKALKKHQNTATPIKNILVSLGQTNVHNVTTNVLQDIKAYDINALSIDVILGASAYNIEEVEQLILQINKEKNHTATLHLNVSNIENFMFNADIAIGAAGSTSWERCCLGLPTLSIVLTDNQKMIADELAKAGAIINLGDYNQLQASTISQNLAELQDNSKKRYNLSTNAAKICDGEGMQRFIERINHHVR